MKKRILYIDHEFHKKTKSNLFLVELLKERYLVDYMMFDPETDQYNCNQECYEIQYDALLLFQVIVDVKDLKERFSFRNLVYVPMYDGTGELPDSFWIPYKEFNIINFSKTLHDRLLSKGFSTNYIQYFPKPLPFCGGIENSVYFWQRVEKINLNLVQSLLKHYSITKIHIHKAADPGQREMTEEEMRKSGYNIEYSQWYDTKNEMLNDLAQYAIYMAPREYEGIGMSFLEAMAMGKVVIAPDHPTMNEYIISGETGLLYNVDSPHPIPLCDLAHIQKNVYQYMQAGYEKWETDKCKIWNWVLEPPHTNQELMKKTEHSAYRAARRFSLDKIYSAFCRIKNLLPARRR